MENDEPTAKRHLRKLRPLPLPDKHDDSRDESLIFERSSMVSTSRMSLISTGVETATTQPQPPEHIPKPAIVGSLCMKDQIQHFARIPKRSDDIGQKMLDIALQIWKLKRPKVLISITGAASDFSMSRNAKDKLLQGLMKSATETNAWFITGGTDAGIMKMIGEARYKYSAHSPLIGVATWGVIQEQVREAIEEHMRSSPLPGAQPLPLANLLRLPLIPKQAKINPNHSHMFLIDSESKAAVFGEEIEARGAFEQQIFSSNQSKHTKFNKQIAMYDSLRRQSAESATGDGIESEEDREWRQKWAWLRNAEPWMRQKGIRKPKREGKSADDTFDDKVPIICVCVQGGPGTAKTVRTALKATPPTPVLLVKGSGGRGASDLIADLHKFAHRQSFPPRKPTKMYEPDEKLLDFLLAVARLHRHQHLQNPPAEGQDAGAQVQWTEQCQELFKQMQVQDSETGDSELCQKLDQYVIPELYEGPAGKDGKIKEKYKDRAKNKSRSNMHNSGEVKDNSPAPLHEQFLAVLIEYWDSISNLSSAIQAFKEALAVAPNKMIWALDLVSAKDHTDLSSAMLRCLLTSFGFEEEENTQDKQGTKFFKKLLWSVEWNDLTVLEDVVNKTWLRRNQMSFTHPMSHALHRALILRRPKLVDFLVNNGASVDWYRVDRDDLQNNKEAGLELAKEALLQKGMEEKQKEVGMEVKSYEVVWEELILLVPEPVVAVTTFASVRREHKKESKRLARELQAAEDEREKSLEDEGDQAQGKESKLDKEQEKQREQQREEQLLHISQIKKDLKDRRKTLLREYEKFVSSVVGEAFHYQMGIIAPEFDLMVWSVLMNNASLSYVWFKEYMYPIRSCLTVCRLYRSLYQRRTIPFSERKQMIESAQFFEQIALSLQTKSRAMNYNLMLMTLEVPLTMWRGMTVVDIAVYSKCLSFVEGCCREAIERRFAGDLLPFSQKHPQLRIQGLKANVTLNILFFLGLFAPFNLKFNSFPIAENLRFPTQRARMPEKLRKGYAKRVARVYGVEVLKEVPSEQFDSVTYSDVWEWIKGKLRSKDEGRHGRGRVHPGRARGLSGGEEASLQPIDKDDMFKLDYFTALKLFWQSPVTLFVADSIIHVVVVVCFTWFVFAAADEQEPEPFSRSVAISPELDEEGTFSMHWPIFPTEAVLAFWFGCKTLSEVMEFAVAPTRSEAGVESWPISLSYFVDIWNLMDVMGIAMFFTGFGMRFYCSNYPGRCAEGTFLWENSVEVRRLWALYYAVALFLLWCRLLRILTVSSRMGPLVVLIIRMGQDIARFALIWAVLLLGFACLLRGSSVSEIRRMCQTDGPSEEIPVSACWRGWWIVRTFVQAFGADLFLPDMQTDASMVGLLALWVVMNVLLLNLLIAIMSNTYSEMQAESVRQYLTDLHGIVAEYSRSSLVVPHPFNLIFLLFDGLAFWQGRKLTQSFGDVESMTLGARMDAHLRRNVSVDTMHKRVMHRTAYTEGRLKELPEDDEMQLLDTDLELEFCWQHKLDAFMERAREKFLQSPELKELLDTWNVQVKHGTQKSALEAQRGGQAAMQDQGWNVAAQVPVRQASLDGHPDPHFASLRSHANFQAH